ncbi:MAG TPA: AmmeMemoRadiSam system protein A [Thermoanaerobaculia bacterium]|nr:AmmeMemoRadiSam system protein A [Thermoanaerobaculia bacterium]HQN07599.1 AmmeMemoRadiSam system protein A [Thermoanaerobaculia bacterium]HQP85802.1 AmmeMemoRadiSam system protein A [Thermoanaerobaculia bacterium]
MLTDAERDDLIQRARHAAARALGLPEGKRELPPPAGRLAEPGASFVTWRRDGRLRGCIGSVEPWRPLAEDVETNAVAALVRDPRFAPAQARDLRWLSVEVSVLSPLDEVSDPLRQLEIGVHGVVVRKGSRSGLLLPQVAPEWGWDVPTLLAQVCLKAGLPEDSWKEGSPPAALYRFSAEVFGESA